MWNGRIGVCWLVTVLLVMFAPRCVAEMPMHPTVSRLSPVRNANVGECTFSAPPLEFGSVRLTDIRSSVVLKNWDVTLTCPSVVTLTRLMLTSPAVGGGARSAYASSNQNLRVQVRLRESWHGLPAHTVIEGGKNLLLGHPITGVSFSLPLELTLLPADGIDWSKRDQLALIVGALAGKLRFSARY